MIVDTSVVFKWFVMEEGRDEARALIGETLFAPELILAELGNAAWLKYRKGAMVEEQVLAVPALAQSFISLIPMEQLSEAALHICLEIDHPIYDCYFLALAQAMNTKLITFDRRLHSQCQQSAYQPLVDCLGGKP